MSTISNSHIPNSVYRKRLQGRMYYYKRTGQLHILAVIMKEIEAVPLGTVKGDVKENMVAHCGLWHVITSIPFTTPCCSTVVFQER